MSTNPKPVMRITQIKLFNSNADIFADSKESKGNYFNVSFYAAFAKSTKTMSNDKIKKGCIAYLRLMKPQYKFIASSNLFFI